MDTPVEADEVVLTHTDNGQVLTATDGKGDRTSYEYDGFDRLFKTFYPSPTTPGTNSTTDYEELGYDPASNVTGVRRRDGQVIGFAYDDLNRQTGKDLPTGHFDTVYSYDLLGRMTSAARGDGHTASFVYDALGRRASLRVTDLPPPAEWPRGYDGAPDHQIDYPGRQSACRTPAHEQSAI